MTRRIEILPSIDSSANASVLEALRANAPEARIESAVETADTWQLGTHPDLVEHLWGTLGDQLPQRCSRVVYEQPVLAHPSTSTIFAFVGGTGTLAMRLPAKLLNDALAVEGFGEILRYPSVVLCARDFGPAWAFVEPFGAEAPRFCLGAYEASQSLA